MSTAWSANPADSPARVRVWFGRFPIVDYTTSIPEATEHARGLGRRFVGLRVTIDPAEAPIAHTVSQVQ